MFPEEGREILWAAPEWHLLAYSEKGDPIAHLGYASYVIGLDHGRQKTVIGIGGVVVRPEHQGRNIPTALFNHLHHSPHALEISNTFTLFCPMRLGSYYQRHGYVPFAGDFTFLQSNVETSSGDFMLMYRGPDLLTQNIRLEGRPW